MDEIIYVTGNKGKQASAQKYFQNQDVKITCYDYDIPEPDVNNIEYIARYKVMEAYKMVQRPCIALDAGFYIDNYPNDPGFPGAFPKRELISKIGIAGLLENMKAISDRSCRFKECLAYYDGIEIKYFYGISEGIISYSIKGQNRKEKWSDLWYVFIPNNCNLTLAQMTNEERNNRPDNHTSALEEFSNWYIQKNNKLCYIK
jgi:XTP/dITP diphosphohydrolase